MGVRRVRSESGRPPLRGVFSRALAITGTIGLLALVPGDAAAQVVSARFAIATLSDTTFVFNVGEQNWVKAGRRGQVVDPARNDEFVAEFRVYQVQGDSARAVVTGQVRRLQPAHVVVMQLPSRPFWRQAFFWMGVVGGAIVGVAAGASF